MLEALNDRVDSSLQFSTWEVQILVSENAFFLMAHTSQRQQVGTAWLMAHETPRGRWH